MEQMKAKRERLLAEKSEADRLERQRQADEKKALMDTIAAGERRSASAESERDELSARLQEEVKQVASFKITIHDLRAAGADGLSKLEYCEKALAAKEAELASEITGQIDKEEES